MFSHVTDNDHRRHLEKLVREMNQRGVAPLDIKLGNVITGDRTGMLYWLDFERTYLDSYPRWTDKLQHQYKLVNRWFGLDFITAKKVSEFARSRKIYSAVDFDYLVLQHAKL